MTLDEIEETIVKLDHIDYVDKMVRERKTRCRLCGAAMIVGEYEKPEQGDRMLNEWLLRHTHGVS